MYHFRSSSKLFLMLSVMLVSFSCVHAANNTLPSLYLSSDDYLTKIFTSFDVRAGPQNYTLGQHNLQLLISSYCNTVLINASGSTLDTKDSFVYSPRQSAFVYLLCKNIDPNFSLFFTGNSLQFTGYFKESDFDRLGLPVKKDQEYLAYSYADDLFNTIISEYFTIKQVDIYGLQTDDEPKNPIKDQVNNFSDEYFDGISICDTSQDLGKHFPKTCTYMTQYLRSAKKMFQNLNILSASGMHSDYASIDTSSCSDAGKINSSYNIILCGLRGDPTEQSLSPFINLVYNELFYYNLFVEYFSMQVTKNPNMFKDSTMDNGVGTIQVQQTSRVNEMKTELLFAKQALNVSIRMLRNAYVTFPIHIGFLMYRENLQDFGKAIAKIATPVYTLFGVGDNNGEFRNVQCPHQ